MGHITSRHVPSRMIADRYRRVWQMAQYIADNPGRSRGELARTFAVSERQAAADMGVIRYQFGLPLSRQLGYRFVSESGAAGRTGLNFLDALTLVAALTAAVRGRHVGRTAATSLSRKIPAVFPPHLSPLAARLLTEALGRQEPGAVPFLAICSAIRTGTWVRLGSLTVAGGRGYTMRPELVLPILDGWRILGECADGRERVVDLAGVTTVEPLADVEQAGRAS